MAPWDIRMIQHYTTLFQICKTVDFITRQKTSRKLHHKRAVMQIFDGIKNLHHDTKTAAADVIRLIKDAAGNFFA